MRCKWRESIVNLRRCDRVEPSIVHPGFESALDVSRRCGNFAPSIGNEKLSEFLAKAVATALHDTAYM